VSIRSPPDLARSSGQVEINGLRSGLLGRVASARGVELVATQGVPNDKFENTFETATTVLGFLGKMPADAAYRIGHKPFQRLGLLNFSAPGISLTLRGSTPFTSAVCIFSPGFFKDLSETDVSLRFDAIDFLIDIESARLTYLGQAMLREAMQPGFASSVFTEAMGMAIALEIARYDSASRSDEGGRGRFALWQMRRLESYVRDHLSDDLSLNQLARLLGVSVRHLSRKVREAKGMSVHRWIAECRVAEARRLLAETDLPVHEVAQRSAFHSAAAFSTAFRAASGFKPGEFRRLNSRDS
jgi:AraC family transcriptional regulator